MEQMAEVRQTNIEEMNQMQVDALTLDEALALTHTSAGIDERRINARIVTLVKDKPWPFFGPYRSSMMMGKKDARILAHAPYFESECLWMHGYPATLQSHVDHVARALNEFEGFDFSDQEYYYGFEGPYSVTGDGDTWNVVCTKSDAQFILCAMAHRERADHVARALNEMKRPRQAIKSVTRLSEGDEVIVCSINDEAGGPVVGVVRQIIRERNVAVVLVGDRSFSVNVKFLDKKAWSRDDG